MAEKTNQWLNDVVTQANELREKMVESQKYYDSENTAIYDRVMTIYSDSGTTIIDPYKSNYKLASGYHKILTEQKVNYSLNSKMVAEVRKKDISEVLGRKWKKTIQEVGRQATLKGYGVIQFYLENGAVKYKVIPSEQIVLCRNGDLEVIEVVRLYQRRTEDNKTVQVAEVYDDKTVTIYELSTGNTWDCIRSEPHLVSNTVFGTTIAESQPIGWGRPPFAIFYNNERLKNDLEPVKNYIDAYDFVDSDFANNLEDFQDSWWVLKNYNGQDLSEFIDMVKKYKAIHVGDDGEVNRESQDIPHEAKKVFLDSCENNIYKFGMGVNTDDIDGNVTNVRIMSMYSNLDLKANTFEMYSDEFLEQCVYFYGYSEDDLEVRYDRALIINELEKSQLANQSFGMVSEKTRLANDPRVQNVDEEIELLKEAGSMRLE